MPERGKHSGFTLVEVIVAFAILALMLGAFYESFGWSLRRSSRIRQQETSWLVAESVLAKLRAQPFLSPGVSQGATEDGLQWTARIEPRAVNNDAFAPMKPFEVTVDVRWGSGNNQRVRLQSIEIASASP